MRRKRRQRPHADLMPVTFHKWEGSVAAHDTLVALHGDEVQVWTATIPPDDTDWIPFARRLTPEERARADRFQAPDSRRAFVFGRSLLRQLLGIRLTVEPGALSLETDRNGKPFRRPSPRSADLRFNVSHSSELVTIALAHGFDVGVDLERIQPTADLPLLAERIFSARELDEWNALPEPLRPEAFFNAWTRKEAYVKATGEGLTGALPQIEVEFVPGRDPRLLRLSGNPETASQWTMRAIPLPSGYAGAVAFPTRPA